MNVGHYCMYLVNCVLDVNSVPGDFTTVVVSKNGSFRTVSGQVWPNFAQFWSMQSKPK